jgi:hypothetical protein
VTRTSVAVLLGSVAGVLAATQPLADTDMWWHLATGRETVAHGLVRADVFSWTARGAPVSTDQWLGQVLMYGAYALTGWWGVAILRIASVVALVAAAALSASLARPVRPLAVVLASLPALLLTRPVWVDRPELLGFVCFAVLLVLLRLGRDGRNGPLAFTVALIAIWANVHGSFALGVVLTVLVCVEGALRDPARRRLYLVCAAAGLLASFATPAGLGSWTAPGIHFLSPPRDIQEWNVVDVRTPLGVAYAVTLGLVIVCVALGPRLALRDVVVLVPVAFLSLTAARQAPLLAIAAVPLFADRADALIVRSIRAPDGEGGRRRRGRADAVMLALAASFFIVASGMAPRQPDERAYPVAALASQSIPTGDGTLARYEWGGWLIWQGVPVFVDGRLTPYAEGVLDDYRRIVAAAPGWRDAIARRGVRTLLVVPTDPVATRAMELGWTVRARSSDVIVIAIR